MGHVHNSTQCITTAHLQIGENWNFATDAEQH